MKKILFLCFAILSLSSFGQSGALFSHVNIPPGPYHPSWTRQSAFQRPSDTFHCGIVFPADFNSRRCAVMLFFTGNPANVWSDAMLNAVGYWQWNGMRLDHITIPNSNDSISIMTVYLWDSVQKASPDPGAVPGIRRWLIANYGSHIDTTRFYLSGISSGAAHVLGCISEQDSIAKYFTAAIEMDGATQWKPIGFVDPFDNATVYEGTRILLNRYNIHIWCMHATGDPTVAYSNATQWRDSCDKYVPGLNHLSTWAGGGHSSVWIPWSTDTAGPEPTYFHALANTIGMGGKPFKDSYYQWLLQFPQVNQKYFPVLTGSIRLKGSDLTAITPDKQEPWVAQSKTAAYTVAVGDNYARADATSGNLVATLHVANANQLPLPVQNFLLGFFFVGPGFEPFPRSFNSGEQSVNQ